MSAIRAIIPSDHRVAAGCCSRADRRSIVVALAGVRRRARLVSWRVLASGVDAGEGRNRFLALWGMMSSLWFFAAILFNIIASVTVPPCFS